MHPRAIIFRARIRFINPVKFRLFERFCHRCNILIVCHIISPARRRNTRCRHIGKRLHTYQRHRQKRDLSSPADVQNDLSDVLGVPECLIFTDGEDKAERQRPRILIEVRVI